MKRLISVVLSVVFLLSCFSSLSYAAPVHSFVTESGVECFIETVLYKSNTHTMHFPSKGEYSVKEESIPGDYAISRDINDLSYKFIFPAGTTDAHCMVSCSEEGPWHGANIDYKRHSDYWAKDENGNVDLTQPVCFNRPEKTAEEDEYGLFYREELLGKDVGGFRDFDKIYWKLEYTCNGEKIVEIFDIALIDFATPDQVKIRVLNYNVAGLPFVTSAAKQKRSAEFIVEQGYDIVAVQEDFNSHNSLVGGLDGYERKTVHSGSIPGGDGLNIFTKSMPIYNETRVEWEEAYGVIDHGADEMTPKGFIYSVIDIGGGIYVDFYNLHADAYSDEGSCAAREAQFAQILAFINEKSAENNRPVIVTGDFNEYMHETHNFMYEYFIEKGGFKDAWIELNNGGDYFNFHEWYMTGIEAWGNWDSVEKFFYRGTDTVRIIPSNCNFVDVLDKNGNAVSDHAGGECEFSFIKVPGFTPGTNDGLEIVETSNNTFANTIKWIVKDFVNFFTNIDQLFSAISRLISKA